MEKFKKTFLLSFLFSGIALFAQNKIDSISIKGLEVGISHNKAKKIITIKKSTKVRLGYELKSINYDTNNIKQFYKTGKFTIAGKEVFDVNLYFNDDKLDVLIITLHSSTYNDIIRAIKKKYTKLKCNNLTLQNKFGAKYKQEECSIQDGKSVMLIKKYLSYNIEKGKIIILPKNLSHNLLDTYNPNDL